MTQRSRLGRDPLAPTTADAAGKKPAGAAKAKTTAKAAPKKKAAGAGGKTPKNTGRPSAKTKAATPSPVPPRPVAEEVLLPQGPDTPAVVEASPAEPIQPVPTSKPLAGEPAILPESPDTPATTATAPTDPIQPVPASKPLAAQEEMLPPGDSTALATADAISTEPIQPIPASMPLTPQERTNLPAATASPEAVCATAMGTPPSAVAPAPASTDAPHPAEVFLQGVLDGLTPEGGLSIDVDVAPDTFGLPVEKLFYFSHVLQLLIMPRDCVQETRRKPGDGQGPAARLSVRLSQATPGRHQLRIYDNGLFFRNFFSEIRLDMETLRPLRVFVAKREGSICLKQGTRCVEFEIIG